MSAKMKKKLRLFFSLKKLPTMVHSLALTSHVLVSFSPKKEVIVLYFYSVIKVTGRLQKESGETHNLYDQQMSLSMHVWLKVNLTTYISPNT